MAKNKVIATLPDNIVESLATTAGVILKDFEPKTFDVTAEGAEAELRSNILFATSGGVSVSASYETIDLADGIDNATTESMELTEIDRWTVEMSGTATTVSPEAIVSQLGAADMATDDVTGLITITPRANLELSDFKKLWYLCPYGKADGWLAIELDNTLSASFAFQSADKNKGTSGFTYKAYSSAANNKKVPITYYIKQSSAVEGVSTGTAGNGGQTPAQEPETDGE
jgi:hypothetical protein